MQENKVQERKYILPLSDFGFKRVFATERDKCLLIDLLNLCVADDFGIITDIAYLPNEQLGEREEEKKVVFDIYCRNQDDDRFIIEMQRAERPSFFRRVNTYVSRIISREVQVGDGEYRIPRVASVNILDYEMSEFKDSERFFWKIWNKDDENKIFSKSPAYYFIELSKFARLKKDTGNLSRLDKWLYLLKHVHDMEEPPKWVQGDAVFERFFRLCEYENMNTMERTSYNKSILEYADVREAVDFAQVKGRAEGRAEEKLAMAKVLLEQGVDIKIIAKATGLTVEEIMGK